MKSTLRKRIRNALDSHRRRAKAAGQTLDYTAADLAERVSEALRRPCPYCGEPLTERTWSCDHATPTSRGGSFAFRNLVVCCRRCNEVKGALTGRELGQLQKCVAGLPVEASSDVFRRLRAGGRIRHGGRKHR